MPRPASRITLCRLCAAPPQPIYEPACGLLFHCTFVRIPLPRTLARVQDQELTPWAAGQGYARYLATSVKGTAEIDWDQPAAREA